MSAKLPKGGGGGRTFFSSKSIVKMPDCWKSHVAVRFSGTVTSCFSLGLQGYPWKKKSQTQNVMRTYRILWFIDFLCSPHVKWYFIIFPLFPCHHNKVRGSHCLFFRQKHCKEDSQLWSIWHTDKIWVKRHFSVCQVDHSLAIFFSALLANLKNQTVWLANTIMTSEENLDNDEKVFQMSQYVNWNKHPVPFLLALAL